jgi:anti-sigma-K factor RskA
MNSTDADSQWDRQRELLAGKVLGDLSEEEHKEVSHLLEQQIFREELFQLERSAAALELATLGRAASEIPEALQLRLRSDAEQFFRSQETAAVNSSSNSSSIAFSKPPSKSASRREWLAWACCAAALILALGLSLPRSEPSLSPALARADFLKEESDLIQIQWKEGKTPFSSPISGDVVWSNAKQMGFMLFDGLPINDPAIEQYQLWIIDPERDDEPIDGGVFDVDASGQVVVPIHAKLAVIDPKAFAITVEKPGGVVVSTQERLPLLATVE